MAKNTSKKSSGRSVSQNQEFIPGSDLAVKLLLQDDIHIEEHHSRRQAWDFLEAGEREKVMKFARKYTKSLTNKHIRRRARYMESVLRRRGYKEITAEDITELMEDDKNHKRLRKSEKGYIRFQDTMLVAIQIGKRPIEDGLNIAAAHIDSPGVVARIKKLKQNFNLAYMPATIRGGVSPKDFFSQPMNMYFYGAIKHKGKDVVLDFSIGEGKDEPKFIFAEQSVHLGEDKEPRAPQLEAILGSNPYPDKMFDPKKRIVLGVMKELRKRFGITEYDLEDADIWFLPSQEPVAIGTDKSMISAYGHDNWANAFPLFQGFLDTHQPQYTKIAIFYDKEETGDTGRGSLRTNFFSEMIAPTIAYLRGKGIGSHYEMLMNSWSLFADVTEPIHAYDPVSHDKRDSAYLGSGVIITPYSGELGNYGGYESSPEMKRAIRRLFEKNKVCYQLGVMGSQEELIAGSSDTFHQDLFTEGVDIGLPIIGCHRASGEIISTIDLWHLYKSAKAFFSIEDHKSYMPDKKKRITRKWRK